MSSKRGLIATHAARLPAELAAHAITLGEGSTPLLRLNHLPDEHGIDIEIWVKFEGANPTGSFKDRGMVVAVTAAKARGARAVICASTGNTSAAAAAFAAAASLACIVLLPAGKVAAGKLAQATAHGARCFLLEDNFDAAMAAVLANQSDAVEIVNSTNPMRIQGQKTLAFEVVEQLGRVPDVHALPVGNAGNITAHWIGYSELAGQPTKACLHCGGDCSFPATDNTKRPRMLGVQAAGAAPFITGAPVAAPETVASAIRIGNPQSWDPAHAVIAESGGSFMAVDDETLLATQLELASREGVFCEPASAAGVAGVLAQAKAGLIESGSVVVCTLTGHGLKDPDAVSATASFEKLGSDHGELEKILSQL